MTERRICGLLAGIALAWAVATARANPEKHPQAFAAHPPAAAKAGNCDLKRQRKGRRRCGLRCRRRDSSPAAAHPANAWQPLFDGHSLAGWSPSEFYHPAEVRVEDGTIVIEMGEPLTGVTWQGEFPTDDYEISLEAQRVEGSDFFCALTFPLGDSFATLVLGGWGGSTVGISSIDNYDASENQTTKYLTFEDDRWYTVRLRVAGERITAWLDEAEEPLVDIEVSQRQLSTRWEVDPSKPLGIAAYQTTAALRNIRYRRLPAEGP